MDLRGINLVDAAPAMDTAISRAHIIDGYDYAMWQRPRHVWPSVDAFLAARIHADGIHSIDCGGLPLDILFQDNPFGSAGSAVVPVFFSGAEDTRQGKSPPFFPGLGVAKARSWPAICVADPSLALDPTLGLAWYSGNAMQPLQLALAAVLEGLAARSERELLLIGGSGGGFAALYYGYRLGSRASVLVWNPQTDWLEYQEASVRGYLAAAYPDMTLPDEAGPAFRQAAASGLQSLGVVHSLLPIAKAAARVPRRLVYAQNASDWHVTRHAAPFMDAVDYTDMGDGFYRSHRPEGLIWFGNWGRGHQPPPRTLVEAVLERMLDPGVGPTELAVELKAGEMATYVDPARAPKDLRQTIGSARVEAATTGETLITSVHLVSPPQGHDQVVYAFYVYAGEERLATRWYGPDAWYIHSEIPGKPATRVIAFARDAFGRQLLVDETRTVANVDALPTVKPVPLAAKRIHIYGSCVSRDPFEFDEGGLTLSGYIARSSLASAFDTRFPTPDATIPIANIASPFQRRMVKWDLSRCAASLLQGTPSDAILLDFIDERFSLLDLDGALVTISSEFIRSGYPVDPERVILSGSAEHLMAWKHGLAAMLAVIDADRLIVNRVRWATHDSLGELLSDQENIARNNATLEAMYDHAATIPGIRFIDYRDELLVADRSHKWGVSPFHYPRAMGEYMLEALRKILR